MPSYCTEEQIHCGGPPQLTGEACDIDGWRCEPTADDYAACPRAMCATCERFDGPVEQHGCRCACVDGSNVLCEQVGATE